MLERYFKQRLSQLPAVFLVVVAHLLLLPTDSTAGPTQPTASSTNPQDAWRDSIEDRLLRLEKNLEKVLTHFEALDGDPADEAREVVEAMSNETEMIQAEVSVDQPVEPRRLPYGGYMELHITNDDINGTVANFRRFVLLFGHEFSDKVSFIGELELENAFVEGGGEPSGELELEQAYVDFRVMPSMSARGGMMLVPIGIINERHLPSTFNGVERPFVDTFIIPSTWFSNGGGVAGKVGNGLYYRAFVMSSLDATGFSAAEGFRDGRQRGFFDDFSSPAGVVRLDWLGTDHLAIGGTYWTGKTGFGFEPLPIDGQTQIFEADATYRWNRFEFRAQYVLTDLDEAAEINRATQQQTGINPNLAEQMQGYYLEGAFEIFPRRARNSLIGFYRYEDYDTQHQMPDGFLPLAEFKRTAHRVGLTYLPLPSISLKVDYNFLDNESDIIEASDTFGLGLGWWF